MSMYVSIMVSVGGVVVVVVEWSAVVTVFLVKKT